MTEDGVRIDFGPGLRVDCEGRIIWIVDANRYGKRFVVCSDEKLTAVVELESALVSKNPAQAA